MKTILLAKQRSDEWHGYFMLKESYGGKRATLTNRFQQALSPL